MQFLYEAGYGSSDYNATKGIIGISQPCHVAVLATAKRVAYELGLRLGKEVGFQVRHDKRVGSSCSIKFMTDEIQLRETQNKECLQKVHGLAVVLVGQRRDSQTYSRNKIKACEDVEIMALVEEMPADCSQDEVLNAQHMDEEKILNAVSLEKDMDDFHPMNMGNLVMSFPLSSHALPRLVLSSCIGPWVDCVSQLLRMSFAFEFSSPWEMKLEMHIVLGCGVIRVTEMFRTPLLNKLTKKGVNGLLLTYLHEAIEPKMVHPGLIHRGLENLYGKLTQEQNSLAPLSLTQPLRPLRHLRLGFTNFAEGSKSSSSSASFSGAPTRTDERSCDLGLNRLAETNLFFVEILGYVALQGLSQSKSKAEATPPDGLLAVPLLRHEGLSLSQSKVQATPPDGLLAVPLLRHQDGFAPSHVKSTRRREHFFSSIVSVAILWCTATWPEEKLPVSSPLVMSLAICKFQYNFLKSFIEIESGNEDNRRTCKHKKQNSCQQTSRPKAIIDHGVATTNTRQDYR
ncbi:hypothetical protein Sjap_008027 [Stephania japonica]|uniref:Tetrahydrofolate dehydrogenase/cyclohydrolase catalytic domain-containing protein n=1 Tax=Stephania japonica TaxID=461633 RepID=A0AAP0JQA7_9MAGN